MNVITLKNNILNEALKLRIESFTFYMSLIYLLKDGRSAKASKTYLPVNALHKVFEAHFGKHDRSDFYKKIKKLESLKLLKTGKDKSKFIDILHKSEKVNNQKSNYYTDITSSDLLNLILDFKNNNQLKVIVKKLYLSEKYLKITENNIEYAKKTFGVKDNSRLKKAICGTSAFDFKSIKKNAKRASSKSFRENRKNLSNKNVGVFATINSLAFKEYKIISKKKPKTASIDFKNTGINLKTFNVINKKRREKNLREITPGEFQKYINQIDFSIKQKGAGYKNVGGWLYNNLVKFNQPVISDELISEYEAFKCDEESKEPEVKTQNTESFEFKNEEVELKFEGISETFKEINQPKVLRQTTEISDYEYCLNFLSTLSEKEMLRVQGIFHAKNQNLEQIPYEKREVCGYYREFKGFLKKSAVKL